MIEVPKNSWMRMRQKGKYLFAQNKVPIIWRTTAPSKGTAVYTIAWHAGQQSLHASGIIKL